MKSVLYALFALVFVSTLSAQCANLSDDTTWGTEVVNSSGILYINGSTTLCTDTYYILNQFLVTNPAMQFNASNIYLDCDNSIIHGTNGVSGHGVFSNETWQNINISNCHISDYDSGIRTMSNFTIVANSTAYNNSDGIYLDGANGSQVYNITGYDNGQSGIYLLGVSGAVIANNTAYNQTYGIFADMANYNNFIGNDLSEAEEGIQLGGTYNSNYNNLTNNIGFNSSFGFYLYNSSNNTLINNTARNNTNGGFIIEVFFDQNNFTNNTAYGNMQGFYLVNSSLNYFLTNTAYDNVYGFFAVTRSLNNTFFRNTAQNNTDTGFDIQTSEGNILTNNTAYNNIWYGFSLANTNHTTLTNNTAYDSIYGFRIYYSNYTSLQRNAAYNNTHGFYLEYANGSTVSNSTSYNNANRGFYLTGSSDNNFTDSVAYNNTGFALYLASNSLNRFTNTLAYNQSSLALVSANSLSNFTNLTLGYNATVGIIRYLSLNVSTGLNLLDGMNIYLRPDWVSLNAADAGAADANVSANITINNSDCATLGVLRAVGFPTSRATILTNGVHYNTVKTCSGNLATFNVSGFSGYTLGQETTVLTLAIPSNPTAGAYTNVTCNASNSEINITLYRDGVEVANGTSEASDYALLAAGSYIYLCNTSGTENYSSAATSGMLRFLSSSDGSTSPLSVSISGERVAGNTLTITVRDGSAAVSGADVRVLYWISGILNVANLGSTDSHGEVEFTPEIAGDYRAEATKSGYSGGELRFTVAAAEEVIEEGVPQAPEQPPEQPPVQPPTQEEQPTAPVQPAEGQPGTSGATAAGCATDADCGQGRVCRNSECVQAPPVETTVAGTAAVEGGAQQGGLLGDILKAVQNSFILIVLLLALLLLLWFFFWKKKGKPRAGNEELIGEEERGHRK
ncbi:MAG: right-handed parallel beta-helix repeat-containing protein [Candidatus Micrarchaeia archaeon]|jgi:nitrous oxidase accessory protein NosD